jgi:hypothetical protein
MENRSWKISRRFIKKKKKKKKKKKQKKLNFLLNYYMKDLERIAFTFEAATLSFTNL